MEKSDTNPMSVHIGRKRMVKLRFPNLKGGMLRNKMLREEDP
jgi:hypothetical protein